MPLFAVFGLDRHPHAMDRRDAARAAHRAYLVENTAPIQFVGVFLTADDNQCGGLYIFEAESEAEVLDWLRKEPFANNDVFEQLTVRRFVPVINRMPLKEWPGPT